MSFGKRLGQALEKASISQSDLGIRAGINANLVNHFIHERRCPSLENLEKILRALWFIDARWLITGEGKP